MIPGSLDVDGSADCDFDRRVAHHWRRHLLGWPIEVVQNMRWKSGDWRNWYNDFILTADADDFVEGHFATDDCGADRSNSYEADADSPPVALVMTGACCLQNQLTTSRAAAQSRNS